MSDRRGLANADRNSQAAFLDLIQGLSVAPCSGWQKIGRHDLPAVPTGRKLLQGILAGRVSNARDRSDHRAKPTLGVKEIPNANSLANKKPKGMWRRTYQPLRERAFQADMEANGNVRAQCRSLVDAD